MVDPAPWRWFFDPSQVDPLARQLSFARHVSVEALIEGFGMSPLTTERLSWTEASERFPVQVQFNQPPFYVRVAELGEWVVAFEYGQLLDLVDGSPKMPPGIDTFSVVWTITTQSYFRAVVDGQWSMFQSITPGGASGDLLQRLADPWLYLNVPSTGYDYQVTLLAAFAEGLGIPPVSAELVRGQMTTAWRCT